MADDIVGRLRWLGSIDCPYGCDEVGNPAADEIERLRNAVDVLLREISADHRPNSNGRGCWWCMSTSWPCVHRLVLDELKEARRGAD